MKRRNFLAAFAAAGVVLPVLSACARSASSEASGSASDVAASDSAHTGTTGGAGQDQRPEPPAGLVFSNLIDDATRKEVEAALLQAQLDQANVQQFFEQVTVFNNAAPHATMKESGWNPLTNETTNYDLVAIPEALEKAKVRLTNCRITAYTLGRSFIHVATPTRPDESLLFMDKEQIDIKPALFTAGNEREQFMAFWGRVATTAKKDAQAHLADLQAYWKKQGVSFASGPASLVSVVSHDVVDQNNGGLFIGHTGILIDQGNGLLWVEKLAFDEPYQAVKLPDRQALNDYLMAHYDDGPNLEYAQPLILENGELIKGYRTIRK